MLLRKKWVRILLLVLAALLLAAILYFAARYIMIRVATAHGPNHENGEWFELAPEGIVSANGTPVTSRMRLGEEREKVIVLFYGGGISIDEYTAAHPYTTTDFFSEDGFYAPDTIGMIPELCDAGIGSTQDDNPFKDWTIIILPYTTGDYHIGTADYAYTDEDGNEQILHHHGYTNFRALMDEAAQYIPGPVDELLIAGSSAGGFGAAMLAEEIIEDYFPSAEHVTLCIDSAFQHYDRWTEVASEVWGAPEGIVQKITTEDIIVGILADLYEAYGDRVTFLYVGSTLDGCLARYQAYLNGQGFTVNDQQGLLYARDLKTMLEMLREAVPDAGVFLFDFLPYSIKPNQLRLTQHTILITKTVFWRLTDRVSVIDWLADAVQGNVKNRGLRLLR